jgi:hypothetical protein
MTQGEAMNAHRATEWAEAKRRCRLSDEAMQMAKELGMSPRGLIKNIPAKSESWKQPVEAWVRELYGKRFGDRRPQLHPQRPAGPSVSPEASLATQLAKPAEPARNVLRDAQEGLWNRLENDELDPETFSHEMEELERSTGVSDGEIEEQNQALLKRWQTFREAARAVAAALAQVPTVGKVMLFGSVAAPLKKEVPRFRRLRRAGVEVWHECNDVDLAVWVSDLAHLHELKRAVVRALNEWHAAHPHSPGVAHHQVDVFLIEPGTNRFRGNLCHYGQCPKGKPECCVPGCGAQPFLQLYDDFRLDPGALYGEHNVVLFDREVPSSPSPAPPEERPY